jgi:hypothetical protein
MDYDNRNSAGSSGEAESGVDKGAGGVFWLVRSDAELRRDWFPKQKSRLAQIESLLQEQAIDGHREAMDFMIDLLLLVECDAYVVRKGIKGGAWGPGPGVGARRKG